ncbi:MAG: hypothetical protein ACRCXZ_00815, partial [Patescibacteria group bacterium]
IWHWPAALRNGLAFEGVNIETKKLAKLIEQKKEQLKIEHPGTYLEFWDYVTDRATKNGTSFTSLYDQRLEEDQILCSANDENNFKTIDEIPKDELQLGQVYNIPVKVVVQPREVDCRCAHDYAWMRMIPTSITEVNYPEHRTHGKEYDNHVYYTMSGYADLFDFDDVENSKVIANVKFSYTIRWYSMQCFTDDNRQYYSFEHSLYFYN